MKHLKISPKQYRVLQHMLRQPGKRFTPQEIGDALLEHRSDMAGKQPDRWRRQTWASRALKALHAYGLVRAFATGHGLGALGQTVYQARQVPAVIPYTVTRAGRLPMEGSHE